MASKTLKSCLTHKKLLEMAGEKFFARGKSYYEGDLVELVFHADDAMIAKVHGTHTYLVEIGLDEDVLNANCTCPAVEDWGSCKHIVAAGLALIDGGGPTHAKGSRLPGKQSLPFEAKYPNIAGWTKDGRIEIGREDYTSSFVRVMDEGGMVWEGHARYPSIDHALKAAEHAIAEWTEENG